MAKKNKNRYSNIWKLLHFKYKLAATNENTLDEIVSIRASLFSGIALLLAFSALLIFVTSFFIIATPIRYYLPGYLDAEVRHQAVQAAFRADSLAQQLQYQNQYIANLKDIFDGTRSIDSVRSTDTLDFKADNPLLAKSEREKEFTKKYEEDEKYNISVLASATQSAGESPIFFKPVKGVISKKFDPVLSFYGIRIETAEKETVCAALDGTIIFAGYDINERYTTQIQHRNGFISIYKQTSAILKKTGDKVRTGEAIALIEGKRDSDNKIINNNFLEFELWYRGNAVNPADYISF